LNTVLSFGQLRFYWLARLIEGQPSRQQPAGTAWHSSILARRFTRLQPPAAASRFNSRRFTGPREPSSRYVGSRRQ